MNNVLIENYFHIFFIFILMIFTILIIISFIINIFYFIRIIKNWLNIEDKTFNELQNYLLISKPDKLFKRYYDTVFNSIKEKPKINKQVITIEFNENYNNYHAGKACMSDIINNLNFKYELKKEDEPKIILKNNHWILNTKSKNIDLSKVKFENIAINFHINYNDLKHIAKTVKRSDLDKLTINIKSLITQTNPQYIIYDIYNNSFIYKPIDVKSFSDYITFTLKTHYELIENKESSIPDIITKFNKISKKYNFLFNTDENSLYLYNPKNGELALPNPDGLIIEGEKII